MPKHKFPRVLEPEKVDFYYRDANFIVAVYRNKKVGSVRFYYWDGIALTFNFCEEYFLENE